MLYHRITRPQFAIMPWNHLNISNRLAAVSVSPFSWGYAPKNWPLGALRGAKVIPSKSPPSICYITLESSEYLKPPGCRERFSIFVGFCPPKLGFRGHLGGQKWYHRIARILFAKTLRDHLNISNRFRVISLHHFVTYTHTHTRKIWIALWRS